MPDDLPPLSHHDILRVSGPFAAAGLRADLDASDRSARRITFVPCEPAGDLDLHYDLYLLPPDDPVLIRRAVHESRLQATASAQGGDLAGLLTQVAALPPASQFRRVDPVLVADSYDLANADDPRLTGCACSVGGLLVELDARTVVGEPMTVQVYAPRHAEPVSLPDDLFTLVDRRWRPLFEDDEGWRTTVRPPVAEPGRSQVARQLFADTMAHVARVLSQPPADYHRRHARRRWWVFGRRYVPIGMCVAIVGALPLVDRYVIGEDTTLHPGFVSLPPILMIAAMLMTWRDLPLFEFPPVPRRLPDRAWSPTPVSNGGAL